MYEDGYTFSCGGQELAKVLFYYGLIDDLQYKQNIMCPFHNDINPSMGVNLDEGKYLCFGCRESGDAFSFVRSMNPELSDLQACKKYFEVLKSKKCEKLDFSNRRKHKRRSSKTLYAIAYDYYHGLSKTNWLEPDTKEIQDALEYMKQRGFSPKTLNNCKAKVNYNGQYPIIFPIMDNGKFKGWVCRTNNKRVEAKRKYLYNEGFSKTNTVVGDYAGCNYVYIVEGYMDKLKMNQNGVQNVVAIFGWYISLEQVEKLRRQGITRVISALDNDEHGREGTERLRCFFDVVRFKYLKGIKDPGDMSKEKFDKMNNRTLKEAKKRWYGKQ